MLLKKLMVPIAQELEYIVHGEDAVEDIIKEPSESYLDHACKHWGVLCEYYQNQSLSC